MAHHQSAKKRIRSDERKRIRNKSTVSKINTMMKKVLTDENPETAGASLKETVKTLDKSASKGVLHKNTAARKKSQLTRHVNSLSSAE